MSYNYDLVVKNFTCPTFECNLVDNLKACEDYFPGYSANKTCQIVSTNLIEKIEKSCGFRGHSICYEPTGVTLPGPDKVMVVVQPELNKEVPGFVWVGIGGLAALGLAYSCYQLRPKPKCLETADKEQLTTLLQKAKVSNGHWNGSQICFEGKSDRATFRQVAEKIEKIYSDSVNFMRERQKNYEKSQKNSRVPGGLFGAILFTPLFILENALNSLIPRPKLNEEEARQVQNAISWRKNNYMQLLTLFKQSQEQLNSNSSFLGKFWNKTLDKLGFWRLRGAKEDLQLLVQMTRDH